MGAEFPLLSDELQLSGLASKRLVGSLGAGSQPSSIGGIVAIFGVLNSAVGAYFAADSAKNQAKATALSYEFERTMANLNARAAEREAQSVLQAGEREIGRYTMRAGQEKAAAMTTMAARGVDTTVGSGAELAASMEIVKEIDALTINSNAVRAANAARMQATNYRTQARLAGVSADNARRTARSIYPELAATSSLLNNAATVASYWYNRPGY